MRKNPAGLLSVIAVIIFAAAVLMFSGSRREEKEYTKDLFAMDTYFSMKAYGKAVEGALELAADRAGELEGLFSVTLQGSDVWRINHGEGSDVSDDTYGLTVSALRLSERTDGALDITMYPVLQKWGFTTGEYRVPAPEEIAEALENTGYQKVLPDGNGEKTIALPEGMQLDLGAVAKGYTGDCILEVLRDNGVTSAILDLGGNVQTLGTKPDGSSWKVGVRNPFDPGTELGVLEVEEAAVVTSGSYERYFERDGRRYGHILDPENGYPAENGLVSVTVIGGSGFLCDGLATALFVMGQEKAVTHWRQHRDFEMILVTDAGQLYITEGIADRFRSAEGFQAEVIR